MKSNTVKIIIAIVLCVAFLLTVIACGGKDEVYYSPEDTESEVSSQEDFYEDYSSSDDDYEELENEVMGIDPEAESEEDKGGDYFENATQNNNSENNNPNADGNTSDNAASNSSKPQNPKPENGENDATGNTSDETDANPDPEGGEGGSSVLENLYTGKDYGGKPITKENLNFDGKTVVFMREWESGSAGFGTLGDSFIANKEEIEKKYNVNIVEKKQSVNLAAELLSGNALQGHFYVVSSQNNNIYDLIGKGQLAYWNDAMANTGLDLSASQYNPYTTGIFNLGGKQWSIGTGFNRTASLVLYNKKLIAAANAEKGKAHNIESLMNEGQWTWSKLTEIALDTTKKSSTGEVTQWGIGMGITGIKALILSNSGHIIHPDSEGRFTPYLDNLNTKEALTQVYNWFNVNKVATSFTDGTFSAGNTAFIDGKVAFYFGNQGTLTQAYSKLSADDYGIAYIPKGPKAEGYISYAADDYSLVVPSSYQGITTELLLLANELYALPEGDNAENQFKNEWRKYFHTDEQYNVFHNMNFGSVTKKMWEGSDYVDLSSAGALGIESIISGVPVTPDVFVATNQPIYSANADTLAQVLKYTGTLK